MTEYNGPERRRGYEELEERIDEHVAHIEDRFSKWFRGGLLAFAIIGLSSFAGLLGLNYVVNEIQESRKDNCRQQNQRHDATVRQFRIEQRAAIRRNPELAPAIRRNSAANLRIIDALVPKQNCEETVQP